MPSTRPAWPAHHDVARRRDARRAPRPARRGCTPVLERTALRRGCPRAARTPPAPSARCSTASSGTISTPSRERDAEIGAREEARAQPAVGVRERAPSRAACASSGRSSARSASRAPGTSRPGRARRARPRSRPARRGSSRAPPRGTRPRSGSSATSSKSVWPTCTNSPRRRSGARRGPRRARARSRRAARAPPRRAAPPRRRAPTCALLSAVSHLVELRVRARRPARAASACARPRARASAACASACASSRARSAPRARAARGRSRARCRLGGRAALVERDRGHLPGDLGGDRGLRPRDRAGPSPRCAPRCDGLRRADHHGRRRGDRCGLLAAAARESRAARTSSAAAKPDRNVIGRSPREATAAQQGVDATSRPSLLHSRSVRVERSRMKPCRNAHSD